MRYEHVLLLMTLLATGLITSAAEPRTAHTFALAEGEAPPTAGLEVASWLVGSWQGTAFGKSIEEVWSPASAGSMVGTFKVIDGDQVEFYELMTLSVDDGRLSLKVKHFSADFVAWEDKADFVNFKLVAVAPGELHFSGISFYQRSGDHIEGYVVMKGKNGISEELLDYHRVK